MANRPKLENYGSRPDYEDALIEYGKKLRVPKPKSDKRIVSFYLREETISALDALSKEFNIKKTALIEEAVLDWKARKMF